LMFQVTRRMGRIRKVFGSLGIYQWRNIVAINLETRCGQGNCELEGMSDDKALELL
jgi:hypothetical protein